MKPTNSVKSLSLALAGFALIGAGAKADILIEAVVVRVTQANNSNTKDNDGRLPLFLSESEGSDGRAEDHNSNSPATLAAQAHYRAESKNREVHEKSVPVRLSNPAPARLLHLNPIAPAQGRPSYYGVR